MKDRTKITYTKYDINPKMDDHKRDGERVIIGKDKDGNIVGYYGTNSHYGKGTSKDGSPDFFEIVDIPKKGDKQ